MHSKGQYRKIGKILKIEINLSVFKTDVSWSFRLGFEQTWSQNVRVFSIKIKRKFESYTKVFCFVVNQTSRVFGGHPVYETKTTKMSDIYFVRNLIIFSD